MFQKVILVFPSLHQLWSFVREGRMNYSDFNSSELTLICNCKKAGIEMAKEKYDYIYASEQFKMISFL
jgi:hypothetical protein